MAEFVIEVEKRDELGKNANRRLRSSGRIPAVVYGHGHENLNVSVDPKDIVRILHSDTGHNTIFKIQVGKDLADVLIKDYQLDPLRSTLMHTDFQVVAMDEIMVFQVPVDAVGVPIGVRDTGGMLDLVLREVEVECLPGNVPDHIQVEVSELEIGDAVRVSDLKVDSSTITILSEPNLVVATVLAPHVEEEEEEEAEEAEVAAEPEVIRKGKAEEEGEKEVEEES
ncbi:MAG TPA: 50S ribosomal protein L25 [Acidobacteriota bacterium]|nr:50S ribosomal protein L25 [Acidobacteriota bacterium]